MQQIAYAQDINASPEQIWAVITDVTRLPDWAYRDGRVPYPVEGRYGTEQTEGVGTVWIGVTSNGGLATQKVTVWEPYHTLASELQRSEQAELPLAQINTLFLEPLENRTRVTWRMDWDVDSTFSLTGVMLLFAGNGIFEEMVVGSLGNLKRLIESELSETA